MFAVLELLQSTISLCRYLLSSALLPVLAFGVVPSKAQPCLHLNCFPGSFYSPGNNLVMQVI